MIGRENGPINRGQCYRNARRKFRRKALVGFVAIAAIAVISCLFINSSDDRYIKSRRIRRETDENESKEDIDQFINDNYNSAEEKFDYTFTASNFTLLNEYCERVHELSTVNETEDELFIESTTCEFELERSKGGFIALYAVCISWLFIAIAIICDDFFVPSLEAISEKLELSEDVAGATFMAAGSSAPELFTSLVGVSMESDVGVGTIVGSAVFNLLVIIALSSAFAGQVLSLDWRPLARDSIFYSSSIIVFTILAWDGKIYWWEALILFMLYLLYICVMKFNAPLMNMLLKWEGCCTGRQNSVGESELSEGRPIGRRSSLVGTQFRHTRGGEVTGALTQRRSTTTLTKRDSTQQINSTNASQANMKENSSQAKITEIDEQRSPAPTSDSGIEDENSGDNRNPLKENGSKNHKIVTSEVNGKIGETNNNGKVLGDNEEEDGDEEVDEKCYMCPCIACCPGIGLLPPDLPGKFGILNVLKFIGSWLLFVLSFPWYTLYTFTIPPCNTEKTKKFYLLSFLASILWIVAISVGILICVNRVGCLIGIDQYLMGLVVVAIGTSVPDALSSILVARDGFGDMAVSNAIGSNVFDINLGLGFPFLIGTLARKKPISLMKEAEWCFHNTITISPKLVPHAKFGFVLLFILVLTLMLFMLVKFRLRSTTGISLLALYILFVAYALIQEKICFSYLC